MINSKANKFAGRIGGASGETYIADMWCARFETFNNSSYDNDWIELNLFAHKKCNNTIKISYC